MKRLMISAFAAVAMLAAATTMLRSHTPWPDRPAGPAGLMTLQDFHAATGLSKLPIEEFEDQSLVYSRAAR